MLVDKFTSILFICLYYSDVRNGFLIPLLLLPYACVSKLSFPPPAQIDMSFMKISCVTDPHHLSSSKGSAIGNDSEYLADSHPRY